MSLEGSQGNRTDEIAERKVTTELLEHLVHSLSGGTIGMLSLRLREVDSQGGIEWCSASSIIFH